VNLNPKKRELYERTVVLPGGGNLGNDMDCDLFAAGPGFCAGFYLLALRRCQFADDSDPAG
jgi:hypothetical protein